MHKIENKSVKAPCRNFLKYNLKYKINEYSVIQRAITPQKYGGTSNAYC